MVNNKDLVLSLARSWVRRPSDDDGFGFLLADEELCPSLHSFASGITTTTKKGVALTDLKKEDEVGRESLESRRTQKESWQQQHLL